MFRNRLVFLFVTLVVLALVSTNFAQGRKFGLFVGVNEYDGENISKLKSCVNDAVNMQAKLSRRYGFSVSNTTLLKDSEATRENILKYLEDYESRVMKGDLFVFFYSGHGSLYPNALTPSDDETVMVTPPQVTQLATGYYDSTIIPVDAHLNTSGKAWGNMILDDELFEIFARFTAKGVQVVFISDSCFSGTLAKSLRNAKPIKFISPKVLGLNTSNWNRVAKRPGRKSDEDFNNLLLAIGSSQDDQFSQAGGSQDMSLFTKVFIAKLDEYASRNAVFTYRSVIDSVKPEVNRQSDGEQTPRLDDRFFESSLLDTPIFSLQSGNIVSSVSSNSTTSACTEKPASGVRVVVKVTDAQGNPVSGATFGIFQPNANLEKDRAGKSDVVILGKTNYKGFYDSCSKGMTLGNYKIKVVKDGYRAYIKTVKVVQSKAGLTAFNIRLDRE